MKKYQITAIILFFALPIFARQKLNEIDLRVKNIGSGTAYATIIKNIGKPLRKKTVRYKASEACSGEAETHLTLNYSGMEITLLGDGRGRRMNVYSIEIVSSRWFASGIKVGADERNILKRFGQPVSKSDNNGETVFYYVTKGNLGSVNFYFRNNKLEKVLMNETLC